MIAKLAFLFLTVGDIYHEKFWVDFFSGADQMTASEKPYSIYVHCKKQLSQDSFFNSFVIPQKVPTTWQNTMLAQIELLREALKDPSNTKFIFLSESTIPVKPFHEIYQQLSQDNLSWFKYWKNPHSDREFKHLPTKTIYKNAQWVILNRKHAQMMVEDDTFKHIMGKKPFDNEHYPSTFLLAKKQSSEIKQIDTTYTDWSDNQPHPKTFTNLHKSSIDRNNLFNKLQKKYILFARKFDKKCDLSPLKSKLPALFQ